VVLPDEGFFRDLELRRLKALVDADMETARALHADDYELITPGAARYSKSEYLGEIESGALNYRVFEPATDVRVRLLGAGGAVVRYQARIDVSFPGGHDRTTAWHTDIYAIRDDRWQVVWSQATEIPRG
jgi:hypothetical protein